MGSMNKSTHKVEVVPVELKPHPNADSLSIVEIDGYTVCARTEDWKDRKIGAYVPPDSVVDTTRPEFSFLHREGRNSERIRVKKLRGIISMGLLVPAPEGSKVGDDVTDILGVQHYEPELKIKGGDNVSGPPLYCPKYDVDTIRKYNRLFQQNELVVVTEKIHGANAKYVYSNGKMYAGSRTNWKKMDDDCAWWKALTPEMVSWCYENHDKILFGEVYGQVQDLNYGKTGANFVAFDVLDGNSWWDYNKFSKSMRDFGIRCVPILY